MVKNLISTQYTPAEHAYEKIIMQQSDIIADQSVLIMVLNEVSTAVMILNQQRQTIFGNKAFLDILEKDDLADITGMRVVFIHILR